MFGFTPQASRLGSISSHVAQLQALGQQQNAAGMQPPAAAAAHTPAPTTTAPGAASPPNQDPISQAYHWLTNQFGGGPAASATPADAPTSMTPDAVNTAMANGGSSSPETAKLIASIFGL